MQFNELSKEAEHLLQEIIEYNQKLSEEYGYWLHRFENLSFNDDSRLRSVFKEVKDAGLIHLQWGDGIPYFIEITNAGYTYFDTKKELLKKQKKLSRREWIIAIVSAIIGGAVGLIPYLLSFLNN